MSEKAKGIVFDTVITKELIQDFSKEEIGEVFMALVDYAYDDTLPTFDDRAIQCLFRSLQSQVDGYNKRYQERCERNRHNIAKRWGIRPNTNDTTVYDGIRPNTNDTTVYDGIRPNTNDTTVYDGIRPNTNVYEERNRIPINKIKQNKIEQNKIKQNKIEEEEKKEKKETSTSTLIKDKSWSDAILMKHHITQEQLEAYLSEFEIDQRCRGGTEHDSERDLKQHFASWLMIRRRNEREEEQKNRNPLGLYGSAEKDYKAGGW